MLLLNQWGDVDIALGWDMKIIQEIKKSVGVVIQLHECQNYLRCSNL